MFRYQLIASDGGACRDEWSVNLGLNSSDSIATRVLSGSTTLLRQRSFKLERLVPVVPTRFVLVSVPINCSADIDCLRTSVSAPAAEIAPKFESICRVVEAIKYLLGPSVPVRVAELISDHAHDHTLIVLDVQTAAHMVDVLEVCDERLRRSMWSSDGQEPSSDPRACRRVIAFPCDARAACDVGGEHALREAYYALPSCMLCCDRLDRSISGIVGNVCECANEACSCILLSSCTTCVASLDRERPCAACNSIDDSWVCLLCGYVGCSRYRSMHITEHCAAFGHEFSLSLTTQQIWDYRSDRFVHRMVVNVNRSNGTSERLQFPSSTCGVGEPLLDGGNESFARYPPAGKSSGGAAAAAGKVLVDAKLDAKIEQCCTEYSKSLTSYLVAQRGYYTSLLHQQTHQQMASGTPSVASSDENLRDLLKQVNEVVGSVDGDTALAIDAAKEARLALRALNEETLALEALEKRSHEVEVEQEALKEEYRAMLLADNEEKARQQREVTELEQAIADVKLNIATQRKMSRAAKGEGLSGSMAVLGSGTAPARRKR